MARARKRAETAASDVPSEVESVSGNGMIADTAPPVSLESKEATSGVMHKSEVIDNKEETHVGSQESEDVDEAEESEDEPEEVDEESEGGLDTSDHEDKIEEPTDAPRNSDKGDNKEEIINREEIIVATNVSEVEEVEERALIGDKKEGYEKQTKETPATDVPEDREVADKETKGEGTSATEVPEVEELEKKVALKKTKSSGKGGKAPAKVAKRPLRRIKKMAAAVASDANISSVTQKQESLAAAEDLKRDAETVEQRREVPSETNVTQGAEVKEGNATGEAKNGKGEDAPSKKVKIIRRKKKIAEAAAGDANKSSCNVKQETLVSEKDAEMVEVTIKGGSGECMVTDGPEEVKDSNVMGKVKNAKGENASGKKVKLIKGKKAVTGAVNDATKSSDPKKESPPAKKNSKMVEGMGMIFMCNAKTKNDCFQYKILGLPESKKEVVSKIYKGMRLFLFDIDLKLMYGIYKAADSGGYNIEPKAFKSAFPSQVRFSVLKDCLPLPEEKFKAAIKGNYYSRNKFNCELSVQQVKDLCKLFQSVGKIPKKKSLGGAVKARPEQASSSVVRNTSNNESTRLNDSASRDQKRLLHESARQDNHGTRERKRARLERVSGDEREKPLRERVRRDDDVRRNRERPRRESGRRDGHIPRVQERSPRERVRRGDRSPRGRDLYARRDARVSPPPLRLASPPPLLPAVSYGRIINDYHYQPPLEYRDPYITHQMPISRDGLVEPLYRGIVPLDVGPVEPLYRGAIPREALYSEPLAREPLYRVPVSQHEPAHPASLASAAYAPLASLARDPYAPHVTLAPSAYDPPTYYRY